jgi:hypothetical protein
MNKNIFNGHDLISDAMDRSNDLFRRWKFPNKIYLPVSKTSKIPYTNTTTFAETYNEDSSINIGNNYPRAEVSSVIPVANVIKKKNKK